MAIWKKGLGIGTAVRPCQFQLRIAHFSEVRIVAVEYAAAHLLASFPERDRSRGELLQRIAGQKIEESVMGHTQ